MITASGYCKFTICQALFTESFLASVSCFTKWMEGELGRWDDWMDGWMDGQLDRFDGWLDEEKFGWMFGCLIGDHVS